jgi:hypothetical protein
MRIGLQLVVAMSTLIRKVDEKLRVFINYYPVTELQLLC